MYTLEYSNNVLKQMRKLPLSVVRRVDKGMSKIAENPYAKNNNVEVFKGEENAYRLRVGDYRVIYYIHDTILRVEVIRIKHRKEVYK